VPGVDVLAKQRDLADAAIGEPTRLVCDCRHRPRHFHAARIGDDTKGAKLVTPFLHRQKCTGAGGDATLGGRRSRVENLELFGNSELRLDHRAAACGLREDRRQALVGLGTHHQIDNRGATDDLGSLGLSHTAGDADHDGTAVAHSLAFQMLETAEFGIDLLRRLLADVASVEEDQIGRSRIVCWNITGRRQGVHHPLGIVDVHLATIGLDEDFFQRSFRCSHEIRYGVRQRDA